MSKIHGTCFLLKIKKNEKISFPFFIFVIRGIELFIYKIFSFKF